MSDSYVDIAEERYAEVQGNLDDELLPNQFKTALGKVVKLVRRTFKEKQALISYSTSKIQGNVLIIPEIQDVRSLLSDTERRYEEGFLENDNLEECNSIILPIDGVDISDTLKGVIINQDLRSYKNGIKWLLDPNDDSRHNPVNLENVLRSTLTFVRTMKHLRNKGEFFKQIDGHQFFFNTEYGEYLFVFDGVNIGQIAMPDDYDESYQSAISCLLLYLLTGTKNVNQTELLMMPTEVEEDDNEDGLEWNQETDSLSGSPDSLKTWNSLPKLLRDTLYEAFFAENKRVIALDEWETVLCESIADTETCIFCGNSVCKTAKQCICCGNSVEKGGMLTRWLIESINQPQYLEISFGRGTTLPGAILGISAKEPSFMCLMYNSKINALGLKNMSKISWFTMEDGIQKEITPGKVLLIEDGLEITFDGYPDVNMSFLGYEVKKRER